MTSESSENRRRRHRAAVALCVSTTVVFAAGCVTKPPPTGDEVRQQALGNLTLDQAWKAGAASADPVRDDWLRTFNDPALDDLVREAVANNPDLRVAAARVEQAAQYLVVAGAGLKPSLGIAGTGGAKAGGGSDPSSALQGVVIAASWELDLWGRVRYARNAARESYASAQSDLEFARQSLAATTAKAWFTATQLTRQVQIAGRMVTATQQLAQLAQDRERVGAGTDADTAIARANVTDMQSTLEQMDLARTQALRALELLVGRYPAAEITARAELLALPEPIPAGMPLQMLERRPDVIAAERRVAAAFNRIGEAKAARLPQITLNASYGYYDSDILQLKQDFENPMAGFGARLLAPLYKGGALNAQVQIRTLEQKEAVADYARIALRALGEVENALAASQSLARRVALLTQSLQQQTQAFDLTQTQLRVGRADRRGLEQQRLNMDSAQLNLLALRTEELSQRINLHLALGGSFEQPQQQAGTPP